MNTILNLTKSVKAFEKIPGPKSFPLLGTSWRYLPFIGDLDMDKLHLAGMKKYEEYGEVVREEVVPGVFVVNVFNPDDIEQVYKNEGKFPARRSHLGILHYREMRPQIYNNGGLLPVNGSEWWRIRSNFQKSLSKVKEVRMLMNKNEEIFDHFFDKFIKPGKPIDDFLSTIARLNVELTWMALFNKRLGAFEDENLSQDSIPSRLMVSAETANCCILKTDATEPIWKTFKTKKYRLLENCLSFIEKIVLKEVAEKREKFLKGEVADGLIGQFFSNPNIDFKDINGIAIDLILGGVDTTSYTSSFLVYHLSNNLNAQKKLNEENLSILRGEKVTSEILNEAVYSRAILKETFRLNPIAIGISRIMDQDSVMGGYFIPKGTLILTQNLVACRQEKYFKNAATFVPERWVKGESEYLNVSPYLILPFSHGPRTCIARRLAEQNLLTFILKMGEYKLKWLGGKLDIVTPLICKPDGPVKVLFHKKD